MVAAYGQIIPKAILDLPKYGCVNVHASLLPKLRELRLSNMQFCRERETGVTIMQMAEGLDTGDMIAKVRTEVGRKNGQELHDELAHLGAELLTETLPLIEAGKIAPEKQDDSMATYAGLITKGTEKSIFPGRRRKLSGRSGRSIPGRALTAATATGR